MNLDDAAERKAFLDAHGTLAGAALAHRLGLTGRGAHKLASALSHYAWNAETAAKYRERGEIQTAMIYETIAGRIYAATISRAGLW